MFERIFEKVLAVWWANDYKSAWLTRWFFVTLTTICAAIAWLGAVPTFIYGHDDFFLLENAWRTLHGLRPHLDFWSPWGPLTFLMDALGLELSQFSPNGIGYASAIFALVIGGWAYQLGRNRLAPAPRALLALYAAVLTSSPHPIGTSPFWLSHAMIYNRYGYALLILVLVECFQPPDESTRTANEFWGGLSTGVAVTLALFLKASYFLTGLGMIAASFVFWSPSARRFLGIMAGFLAVGSLGLAYLRFGFGPMLSGLRFGAAARAQSLAVATPIHVIGAQLFPLLCGLVLAIAASFLKSRRPGWLGQLYLPIATVIVCIGDIALLSTNAQLSGLPLLAGFAVFISNGIADTRTNSAPTASGFAIPYFASVLLLAGLLFFPQFTSDLMALPIAAARKIRPPSGCAVRFTESRIASLILCDNSDDRAANGSDYTTYINDGAALLRRYGKPTDKILTMDMQNPFPYILGWLPPRGGLASTRFDYTLSAQFRPSFDEYFGDATLVMVPKHPALRSQDFDGFYEIYGPTLEHRFDLIAESDWFRLYKRK